MPSPIAARTAIALFALSLSGALVTGCSTARDSGGGSTVAPGLDQADRGSAGGGGSVAGGIPDVAPSDGGLPAPSAGGAPANVPPGGGTLAEQIVRTGDVSVDVDDITSAANRVIALVDAAGGNVGSDQRSGNAVDGSADLVVRLPPDRFDGVLETVSGLGEELSRSVSADDVSTVVADVDARVRSLQNSVDRLLSLAAQAVSVSDLLAIESELSARQSELESLQAQQRALADQVSLATLSVCLSAASEPDNTDSGFLASLGDGWNALLDAGRGLISIVGLLLPWLLVLVVIAVPMWFIMRRRRSSAARRGDSVAAVASFGSPDPAAVKPSGETVTVPGANEPDQPHA